MNTQDYATITQTQAHDHTSDRYSFIPTSRVVDLLAEHNWFPSKIREAGTRKESNRGYQNHIIRFRRAGQQVTLHETLFPEIVLFNSHMGTSAFKLMMGLYRQVCSNGLTVGDTYQSFSVRHVGFTDRAIHEATEKLALTAPLLLEQTEKFRSINLNQEEKIAFAQAAIELKWNGEEYSVDPRRLIQPVRYADRENDLFTVMNVVQENLIKGGVRQVRSDGSSIRSRAVKNIKEDLRINQALWTLTEKMAELKA